MGQRGDAARLEALGCSGYLLKPVKQHMLFDALIAVLSQKSGQTESGHLITRHTISEARRQDVRILLAEDNPVNQKLTVIILQKAGFSVDAVDNGLQAVEKVKTVAYHVVLMDVQMPELDGLEAARRIRAEPGPSQHIPIIAMTAHALKGDRELCLEAGMDDYISKPIDPKGLLAILDRWTANQSPEESQEILEAIGTQDYSIIADEFPVDGSLAASATGLFGETPGIPEQSTSDLTAGSIIVESTGLPLDIQSAMPRFDNDQALFLEMCQELIRNMPARMEELNSTLGKHDTAGFTRAAHNLKGVSANFSATQLNRIALELEKMGRQDDLSDARALLKQLELENARLFEFLFSLGVQPPI